MTKPITKVRTVRDANSYRKKVSGAVKQGWHGVVEAGYKVDISVETLLFSNVDLGKMKGVEKKVLQIFGLKALCYVLMSYRYRGYYQEERQIQLFTGA